MDDFSKKSTCGKCYWVRTIILTAVLLATLGFVIFQKDGFMVSRKYINDMKVPKTTLEAKYELKNNPELVKTDMERYLANQSGSRSIDMKGNVTLRQEFVAKKDKLTKVQMFFSNAGNYKAKGKVTVSLLDAKNRRIAETELKTNLIVHDSATVFSFVRDSEAANRNKIITTRGKAKFRKWIELDENKKYKLQVKSVGVKSKKPFAIKILSDKKDDANHLTRVGDDGEKVVKGEHLFAALGYRYFKYSFFSIFIAVIALAIVFVVLPIGKIEEKINRKRRRSPIDLNRMLLRGMFILTPLMGFYIISKIAKMSVIETLELLFSFQGLLNIFIIAMLWWIFYVITNRTKAAIILTTLSAFCFAFANYMMLLFRDSPLIATDIINWRTGMEVAGGYSMSFNRASLWAIMLTVIWIVMAIKLKGNKGLGWKKRGVALISVVAFGFLFNYVFFTSSVIEDHNVRVSSFRPKSNYYKHGYALSFLVTVNMSIVEKPKNYSPENVRRIAARYKPDTVSKVTATTKKTPNIIGIMNESFADLQFINKFKTNKDYMPFFNSLKKNTIKGTMHTSIFGGGTACTEFEFLTGFSMQHLPFHSVPYTNRTTSMTPSLTWKLKQRGYAGDIAFHPGMNKSYNRNNAYPNLGFNKYISMEDLNKPEKIRSFISDKQDYEVVKQQYEKAKANNSNIPFYMFNVTIQNHGGYLYSSGIVDSGISIEDDSLKQEEAGQFLNLMKKSDDALKELIDYFKKVDEPTVLVFFGDHQPRVENEFYNELFNSSDKNEMKLLREEKKYRVPFMIWANYDIKEKENVNISANYLSAYTMKAIGGQMSGYDKYLMDMYKKMPVITDIACMDSKGNLYDPDEKDNKMREQVREYQAVQYNGLIDTENRVKNFYYLKEKSGGKR